MKQVFIRWLGINNINSVLEIESSKVNELLEEHSELKENVKLMSEKIEELTQTLAQSQVEITEMKLKLSYLDRTTFDDQKDESTEKEVPWVAVVNTHIDPSNIKNGFFELDWNEYFVSNLRRNGYGSAGDSDETVVNLWFKDLAYNILLEEGGNPNVDMGMIDVRNVRKIKDTR